MTAARAVKKVTPPSSPFAELLRRSRFATFDPSIRQSYYTPPDHASRGDWGLKRPLSLRRRNAFISIPAPFDSRAQYIEWSNAENEVRFIRRFEEMQVSPTLKMDAMGSMAKSNWEQTLGTKNSSKWVMDSEFAFHEEGVEVEEMAEERRLRTEEAQNEKFDENLTGLGREGPGRYGSRRRLVEESAKVNLTPNIYAMSPKEFDRYVRKLRELRPKFNEYIRQAWEEEKVRAEEREQRTQSQSTGQSSTARNGGLLAIDSERSPDLLSVAQTRQHRHHVRFLEQHTASTFADPNSTAIEQRPHQVAGLLYARLSPLHSQLHAQTQPGIVLQAARKNEGSILSRAQEDVYTASLGGMTPIIRKEHWASKRPLLDISSKQGVTRDNLTSSIANMRLKPGSVVLTKVPRTVGVPEETGGLKDASISAEAMIETGNFGIDNPYMPGSILYSGLEAPLTKQMMSSVQQERDGLNVEMKKSKQFSYGQSPQTTNDPRRLAEKNKVVLNTLDNILKTIKR
ncbi:hypothetical protein E1B28_009251 [Marasmius oreades]|uniref:Uncharacterized protein n=1 Tax=Marasmius oreades TaxID=181124 RepID=A0A9P7S009_9AGAR|nr:uncharacterized protein E1B28_009251 [Marasmius oreades]KAG7092949.1 hypothetical protein E1B28_009251 [Marasmius oreades]